MKFDVRRVAKAAPQGRPDRVLFVPATKAVHIGEGVFYRPIRSWSTGVFAGDLVATHRVGVEFVRQTAMQPVPSPFDIVITSNSGYPLDLNLYQAVKGMSAAAQIVRPGGDIIVAGKNWGCGSSREQAVTCLKEAGVGAIVARSFARIYFRNCINAGLPIVTCDAVEAVEAGDEVTIDFAAGIVTTPRGEYAFPPLSPSVMEILEDGGLIPHVRKQLGIEG